MCQARTGTTSRRLPWVRELARHKLIQAEATPGSGGNETAINLNSDYRQDSIPLSPPQGQGTRGRRHVAHRDEAARDRARHPSRQSFGTTRRIRLFGAESHLGSTLKPGGAVLTGGVFRRSRSVACIRADASPSEKRNWLSSAAFVCELVAGPRCSSGKGKHGHSKHTRDLVSDESLVATARLLPPTRAQSSAKHRGRDRRSVPTQSLGRDQR
jgi:hypothetical protein